MGERLIPEPIMRRGFIPLDLITGDASTKSPASLIRSLETEGQLVPVILTENVEQTEFRAVDGRRRIAAARHLGWESIDANVYPRGDINEAEVGLTANSERSSNPWSEWLMVRELMGRGLSDSEITQRTGMVAATIQKRRKLATLSDGVIHAIETGRIAAGVAEQMSALPKAEQDAILDEHEGEKITGKMVKDARSVRKQAAWAGMALPGMGEDAEVVLPWYAQCASHVEAALITCQSDAVKAVLLETMAYLREESHHE